MLRLRVRNVPFSVSREAFEGLCRKLGIAGEVRFVRDAGSGRYDGEAYVSAADEAAAERAAEQLQGYRLAGCQLEVEVVDGSSFFDQDGLFADGAASGSRKDGEGR